MKRSQTYETIIVVALLLVAIGQEHQAWAQGQPHRITFTNKGPGEFIPGSDQYERTLREYHPRALTRRRNVGMNPELDGLDRPLHEPYVTAIRSFSDSILTSNPWFNYIVVNLDSLQVVGVKALPFVKSAVTCNTVSYGLTLPDDCGPIPETHSTAFLEVGNVNSIHDLGVYGQGARIGVIDNGFRWRAMTSLAHLNVDNEYDFIFRREITANQSNDVGSQDEHGSVIMSVAAAWHTDSVMGVAPLATYLLAKTEDMRYERRIEEDSYVEALWWLEKNGVDVASSSLGYRSFDSTDESTPYELLDGKTTYAARAINLAAARGVICVTAAGNNGPSGRSISTPADADSALAIGAISVDGSTPWFASSWGPNAAGRQKPDFAAPGMKVPTQAVNGAIIRASGTSLATPYVAAQVGLLRQLYPNLRSWEIRDAMRRASVYAGMPDTILGHGAVNVVTAACLLGPTIAEPAVVIVNGATVVLAPIFSTETLEPELTMSSPDNSKSTIIKGRPLIGQFYIFELDDKFFVGGKATYRITALSKSDSRIAVYPATGSADITQRSVDVPCGMRLPPVIVSVAEERLRHSSPSVTGVPLSAGARELTVTGLLSAPYRLRLVHAVTGQSQECELIGHDSQRTSVMCASGLSTGAWILECRTPDQVIHLP
ncbi:MAG: S8 family serine peptidase, partial [Candidatus Kapaibacterium sp.]